MKLAICVTSAWRASDLGLYEGRTYEIVGEFSCGNTPMVVTAGTKPMPYACETCHRPEGFPRSWFRFLNDPDFKEDELPESLSELEWRRVPVEHGQT